MTIKEDATINIHIVGQHIDMGQSLQNHVREIIENTVMTYFERSTSANVHFSKNGYLYKCDILVNKGTSAGGGPINANGEDRDIFHSFDLAMIKLKKQLRIYKNIMRDHHHKNKEEIREVFSRATKYTLSPYNEEIVTIEESNPTIVAEKSTDILYLTVNEAVMRMDLLNLRGLMFKNRGNDRMNVVYYREDGNIAWIDPKDNK